jgi:hypothetical protein
MDIETGHFTFRDTQGETLAGGRRFRLQQMLLAGRPWPDR